MNSKEKKKKLTLKNFKGSPTFKATTPKVSTLKRGFEKNSNQYKNNLKTNPLRGGLVKRFQLFKMKSKIK